MGGASPIDSRSMLTETVLQQKNRSVNLKPSDLVLVKADAFKGKRKIKYRQEGENVGGGVSNCDQQTNTEGHESSN